MYNSSTYLAGNKAFPTLEDGITKAHAFGCELLLHLPNIIGKVFQIIPMALHRVDLVGKDTEARDFRQGAWVIQTFQHLGQCKIESEVLREEAHIIVVHLYSFNRCCQSEVDGPVMDWLIPTFGPYKVSIPICFLIADKGERDETGTIINLEGGISRGFGPLEPRVTGVTIF